MPPRGEDAVRTLAERVRELVVATDDYRRTMAQAAGVGVNEATTLGELLHRGPLPPSAIARRLGIASASVTSLLDRLTVAGFVERHPNPVDRRSVLVVLTPGGRATIRAMFDLFTDDVEQAVRAAEPRHVAEFARSLTRMVAALQARATDRASLEAELARRTRGAGENRS
ncbi:MarR family winged helix-turn-helix transcriptional regulator [Pseudonocardia kujensis]|uniref:MarR family winged helix-turn-helix transcriptional regulator n=1 Tax=Pseudonocardia kujensis TaxID=1128675 RepID=UPI001E3F2500|nr:MarR family winged helix-turn-helix transcriptional regulator [Pseudonocardia kujensis]MCE0762883.1 MarR family winged helix-turn-helix transcriptional regulator [Pseudonocardia kujensis]